MLHGNKNGAYRVHASLILKENRSCYEENLLEDYIKVFDFAFLNLFDTSKNNLIANNK